MKKDYFIFEIIGLLGFSVVLILLIMFKSSFENQLIIDILIVVLPITLTLFFYYKYSRDKKISAKQDEFDGF